MPDQPTTSPTGRPREDDRKRVRVSVSVAATTDDSLRGWLGRMLTTDSRTNMGRVVDRLVAFAKRKKFDPIQQNPESVKQKETA